MPANLMTRVIRHGGAPRPIDGTPVAPARHRTAHSTSSISTLPTLDREG